MRAKTVNEAIGEILKPKMLSPEVLEKNFPDLKRNNERVHKFFSGNLEKVLNMSEHLEEFYTKAIREIEEKYLELYQIAKMLDNKQMITFLDSFFDTSYFDPIGRERRHNGNHFSWFKDKINFYNKEEGAKFLNTNFYDIVKEHLDKLNVKMINPEFTVNRGLICCYLDKNITMEQAESLNVVLKQQTDYRIMAPKEVGVIYPLIKNEQL